VITQTYTDLEIICVNDFSPDKCYKILEEYTKKDKRIKIITHTENKGLSGARNTGFKNATGKYIYFLDSDDWIENDYLEVMYDAIKFNNIDAIYNCNVINELEKPDIKIMNFPNFETEGFYKVDTLSPVVWLYLFKKSFLDKYANPLFYEVVKVHEDVVFLKTTVRTLKQIYVIKGSYYHYFRRLDSLSSNFSVFKRINYYYSISSVKLMYDFYKKHNLLDIFNIPLSNLFYHLTLSSDKEEYYNKMKQLLIEIQEDIFKRRQLYSNDDLVYIDEILDLKDYANWKIFRSIKKIEQKTNKIDELFRKTYPIWFIKLACCFIPKRKNRQHFRKKHSRIY
jgi:glycosyltransferase involved in cell wall biosynthesis